MQNNKLPEWLTNLDDEEINFIKQFILASGSLKKIAQQYDVSYPTVRLRLDRLIQKIQITDNKKEEPFVTLIKRLALDEQLDFNTAKIIITEYKKSKEDIK